MIGHLSWHLLSTVLSDVDFYGAFQNLLYLISSRMTVGLWSVFLSAEWFCVLRWSFMFILQYILSVLTITEMSVRHGIWNGTGIYMGKDQLYCKVGCKWKLELYWVQDVTLLITALVGQSFVIFGFYYFLNYFVLLFNKKFSIVTATVLRHVVCVYFLGEMMKSFFKIFKSLK